MSISRMSRAGDSAAKLLSKDKARRIAVNTPYKADERDSGKDADPCNDEKDKRDVIKTTAFGGCKDM
jgi:hypothetical protein